MPSLTAGSRSLPTSAGSRSESSPGALGPESADARPALVAERQHALAVPGGHELERLRARVLDPRALDVRIEPADVDELRAVPVGARGERAHEVLLAGLAADGDDLVLLHVGAEADDEVGEAREGGVVHPQQVTRRPATFLHRSRRGARVVESGGLENRCAGNRTEGSNPSPSAVRASCRGPAAAEGGDGTGRLVKPWRLRRVAPVQALGVEVDVAQELVGHVAEVLTPGCPVGGVGAHVLGEAVAVQPGSPPRSWPGFRSPRFRRG